MIPGLSTAKLIGRLVGLLALIGLVAMINGWRVERNELRAWQASVVTATADASANSKLKAKDVPAQIRLLGQAIVDLKAGIAHQNAAVDAMAAASAKARHDAEKAVSSSKERAKGAETTADKLRASAGASRPANAACEPSDALKEAWR